MLLLSAAGLLQTDGDFSGAPGQSFAIDVARTPARISGAVKRFVPAGAEGGTMTVRLRGSMLAPPGKAGEVLFDLRKTSLGQVPWSNRARLSAEVRVSPSIVGEGKRNWYRAHRARLFVADVRGRRVYLPNISIVDRPKATDGWLPLGGMPTADVPMPIGYQDEGFDGNRVVGLGVNVEAFNREGEIVEGTVELRGLKVSFETPITPRVMPPDPAINAGEAARAAAMNERLRARCGLGDKEMAVGVNLAWPTARSPAGEDLQLYGRILDGGTRWFDKLWDIGEPLVAESLRTDFREIRATFGRGAVVRLWLLADLRSGMEFDAAGDVVKVTDRARTNMKALLDLAVAEGVVLIPVLLDFGLADGVSRTGPDGAWQVNERPDLITDAGKRKKLVNALEAFMRPFAGHPAVLAWDVMNEPENAAAVVTPAHFADVQALVRELVDAVHRVGDLATVGHHNVIDPQRFFRGRVASDLGQVHYYPFLETRPNQTPFGERMGPTFGPLPAGWGELQVIRGQLARQLSSASKAGHRLFLYWAWRGHQETGDGFEVKPHADEIKAALTRLPGWTKRNDGEGAGARTPGRP